MTTEDITGYSSAVSGAKVTPITLQLSEDDRAFLLEQGNTEQGLDAFVTQSTAEGRTQEELDTMIAETRRNVERAKAEREAHEAAQAAAERKANRFALAGMALQGLLANPDVDFSAVSQYSKAAVAHADGLLDALDAPAAED